MKRILNWIPLKPKDNTRFESKIFYLKVEVEVVLYVDDINMQRVTFWPLFQSPLVLCTVPCYLWVFTVLQGSEVKCNSMHSNLFTLTFLYFFLVAVFKSSCTLSSSQRRNSWASCCAAPLYCIPYLSITDFSLNVISGSYWLDHKAFNNPANCSVISPLVPNFLAFSRLLRFKSVWYWSVTKYSANMSVWFKHWRMALMKHVFPWLRRPMTPGVKSNLAGKVLHFLKLLLVASFRWLECETDWFRGMSVFSCRSKDVCLFLRVAWFVVKPDICCNNLLKNWPIFLGFSLVGMSELPLRLAWFWSPPTILVEECIVRAEDLTLLLRRVELKKGCRDKRAEKPLFRGFVLLRYSFELRVRLGGCSIGPNDRVSRLSIIKMSSELGGKKNIITDTGTNTLSAALSPETELKTGGTHQLRSHQTFNILFLFLSTPSELQAMNNSDIKSACWNDGHIGRCIQSARQISIKPPFTWTPPNPSRVPRYRLITAVNTTNPSIG